MEALAFPTAAEVRHVDEFDDGSIKPQVTVCSENDTANRTRREEARKAGDA